MRRTTEELHWTKLFLLGSLLQIGIVCIIKALLQLLDIEYGAVIGLLFLAVGGLSTAIWGIIISLRLKRVEHILQIVKDFFDFKQSVRNYFIVFLFLGIVFGRQIVCGQIGENVHWYTFVLVFVQAVLFGGIEEIGWRYTFQPIVETKHAFEAATLITFLSWGVWHYCYFYITDTLSKINHVTFLTGLLLSCFVLGGIYRMSGSLWLCVLYHSLYNVLSQTLQVISMKQTIITTGISLIIVVMLVHRRGEKCEGSHVNIQN